MPEVVTKQSKAGWTTVAFGDVVRKVTDKVDPEESGLERYIAGEHMDTDDLRIRRWGEIGDGYLGPAFHMRFKPGHVLYGSRRTYLRKVAVADFEGITANTTYVLESADPKVLLPGLLPFIMQTEAFNQHSIRESRGSVNPYVNFSDLASFEFALPPIEEQRRMVEALDAIWCVIDATMSLTTNLSILRSAHRQRVLVGRMVTGESRIEHIQPSRGWDLVPASTMAVVPITSGVTPRDGQVNPDPACRFVKVGDLSFDGRLLYDTNGSSLSREAFDSTKQLHVADGDVLTNIVGPPLGKVSIVPSGFGPALINQAIVRYRMPSPDLRDWLAEYLMSHWAKHWLFTRSKKTSGQRNINARTCGDLPVPLPPPELLHNLCNSLREHKQTHAQAHNRFLAAKGLLEAFLREMILPL